MRSVLFLTSLVAGASLAPDELSVVRGSHSASSSSSSSSSRRHLRASPPASDRSLKSAQQKAAKEAAGAHYYELKAKTTKAVPDNGLNAAKAAAAAEAEAESTDTEVISLDADFEKKESKRESRKADKKARESAEDTGVAVHTWDGETRRQLGGSPTKSPSSGLHKPTWKPSSKPIERHRQLSAFGDFIDKFAFWRNAPAESESSAVPASPAPVVDAAPATVAVPAAEAVAEPEEAPAAPEAPEMVAAEEAAEEAAPAVMTTTASDVKLPRDQIGTGLAPGHKQNEPMYPTVTNVPFPNVRESAAPGARVPIAPKAMQSTRSDSTEQADTQAKQIANKAKQMEEKLEAKVEKMEVKVEKVQAKVEKVKEEAHAEKPAYEEIVAPVQNKATEKAAQEVAKAVAQASMTVAKPAPRAAGAPLMSAAKPLMTSSGKSSKSGGIPSKSPSSGIHKPTWKPSSKPAEHHSNIKGKSKGDKHTLIEVDFDYGSFHDDDFTQPAPGREVLLVKQLIEGMGKRAGDWKEKFEAAFVPATAKVLGINKHGITITSVDRIDTDSDKWQLQITYVVYDVECVDPEPEPEPEPLPMPVPMDVDTKTKTSSKSSKKTSKKADKDKSRRLKSSSKKSYVEPAPVVEPSCLDPDDVATKLNDKTNQAAVNAAMADAGTGKGNEPTMGKVTVQQMAATSQPTSKPVSKPSDDDDDTPTSNDDTPTSNDDTPAPKPDLGKMVVVKQEVTGITKRADNWKVNMETALLPLVAKAIGISKSEISFNEVQRRYETGTVWVEFSFHNSYGFHESDVVKKVSDKQVVASMSKALKNADLGKGNEPDIGSVKVDISHETLQPTAKPTERSVATPKPTNKPVKSPSPTDKPVKTSKPSDEPTHKPTEKPVKTNKPSDEPTHKPTEKPVKTDKPTDKPVKVPTASPTVGTIAAGTPVIVIKQEVTGITKRSNSWKTNMEAALSPIIADALNVKRAEISYTEVQRRYETGTVWVEFTVPNTKYSYKEHEVVALLTDKDVTKSMTQALKKAGVGKGNEPAAGDVKVQTTKATAQPTSKPTPTPEVVSTDDNGDESADDDDDDDDSADDVPVVVAKDDDSIMPLPTGDMTEVVHSIKGVTKAEAKSKKFSQAMTNAVAVALGVNVDDVYVTKVKVDEGSSDAVVTYQIADKYSLSKKEVRDLLAQQRKSMEESLVGSGYKSAKPSDLSSSDVTSRTGKKQSKKQKRA